MKDKKIKTEEKKARIISIANNKGGVGKTTTTANLGKALSMEGYKVLLIDFDPQSNLTQNFDLKEYKGPSITEVFSGSAEIKDSILNISDRLDIVPSNKTLSTKEKEFQAEGITGYFRLKNVLKGLQGIYDIILIDTPPTLSTLTVNALISSSDIIIVVESQYFSIQGLETILGFINEYTSLLNIELNILGMLVTKLNRTKLRTHISNAIGKSYNDLVFETKIRESSSLGEAQARRKDIFSYDPNSNGAVDYAGFTKEVINRLR